MDDPFFPAEIPLMVLHFLVANQCEDAAMKLIEGVPQLKAYVPAKPAHISDALYLKRLMNKSSVNRSDLKKLLWDYANTKILVEEILEDEENIEISNTDSLLSKVKVLQKKLNSSGHVPSGVKRIPSPLPNEKSPPVVKIDASTSTENYECPKCLARKPTVVPKTDSGCQTEEVTGVQFGLQDEIPIIFYEKLLNDNNLQHKIAQTINEHMQDPDPLGEQNDRISKISSKTDPEIDKFLVDLLRDTADDSSQSDTGLIQKLGGPISVAHIERDLSSMFDESENMPGKSNPSAGTSQSQYGSDMGPNPQEIPPIGGAVPPLRTTTTQETQSETPLVTSSPSNSCEDMDVSFESTIDVKKVSDLVTPPGTTGLPKRSQRLQSVKRITPTPLASLPVNPVFNTSVIVEKKRVEIGDKSSHMTVIKADVQTPNWQQLGRRPINPKIPAAAPRITNNVTILNENRQNDVFKFDQERRDFSCVQATRETNSLPATKVPIKRASNIASVKQDKNCPPSAHKRKTTPVKLTPEKAKNLEYNFMHYYHETKENSTSSTKSKQSENDSNKSSVENEADSGVKKTPMSSSSVLGNQHKHFSNSDKRLVLANENSQHDVTPMQPPPTHEACSSSTYKTVSPNALQRLIASANKVSTCTTNAAAANFMNKKKSYSTPRKRKHVRNLSFATPPSLKAATPGSEPFRGGSDGHKRKATDELSVEFRSKKRLNWPDSEKKNIPVVGSTCNRRASESVVEPSLPSTSQPGVNLDQHKPQTIDTKNAPKTAPTLSMPTILEESMSNVSMSMTEEQREVTLVPISSSSSNTNQVFQTFQTAPGSNQLTILTIPITLSDGTTRLSYYQLSEDMGKLIPITVVSDVNAVGDQELLPLNINAPTPVFAINQQETAPVMEDTSVPSAVPSEPSEMPPSHQANTSLKLSQNSSNMSAEPSTHSHNEKQPSCEAPLCPPLQPSTSPAISVVEAISDMNPANAKNACPKNLPKIAENDISSELPKDSNDKSSSSHVNVAETGTSKPRRKSRKQNESQSQTEKPNEPSTSKSPSKTVCVRSSARLSRSKSNEKKQPDEDECMKVKERIRTIVPSKPSYFRSDEREALQTQFEETQDEEHESGKGSRRGKGKGKQNAKPKKPKITMKMNVKELFGDSPKKRTDNKSKLPSDVVAAQAVASQAVPLGCPHKSPRKQPSEGDSDMKTALQKVLPNVHRLNDDLKQSDEPGVPEPAPPPTVLQPTQTAEKPHQQPENVFNIVPAPLGFPEPTPIKNFAATGCLNVSDITCSMNGPLITPFKSCGPVELNETHFTLPPTPRVMLDDNDSNSNSNSGQFLRLTFDSLYPANLLTSTPLKPGIPRTPGRGSSSSNSQSPIQPGKAIGVVQSAVRNQVPQIQQQQAQTSTMPQTQAIVHPVPSKPIVSSKVDTVTAVDLTAPNDNVKSDGEISSSDDEDDSLKEKHVPKKPQKPLQAVRGHSVPHHQPQILENRTQVSHSSISDMHKQPPHYQQQQRPYSRPPLHFPSLRSNPCPPSSEPPLNPKRTQGINFSVGGREKHLTISEKETLYSLISMGTIAKSNETRKDRPVLINPTHPMVTPAPQISTKDEDSVPAHIQSKSLGRLLHVARRKTQASKNT